MSKENIGQEFRLKNIDDTRFVSSKKQSKMNWWIESTKRFCTTLNYIEYFLIVASAITGCI